MTNITLEDACHYKHLDKLKPETRKVMVNAPQSLQRYLNTALMESFNTNLMRISHRLRGVGFSAEQAIEVIYSMPAHRPSDGVEIERAVSNAYNAAQAGEVTKSKWPKVETPLHEVKANIKQAGIVPMSEDELLAQLGDTPEEIDNVADFISHYFKGVERPVYIGGLYHGAIEHVSMWLADPETIDALGYDQVLANPMKRRLTPAERRATVTDAKGKVTLKYPSGGRGIEFASDTMDVITFECDKISAEEQFAVIAYLAQYLPLVSIVYSGGKSYHATFSLSGLSYDVILRIRRALVDLGGDGGVMSPYQLVRLGGVTSSKDGNKFQRVLWMDGDARNATVNSDKLAMFLPSPNSEEMEVFNADAEIPDTVFPVPAGGVGNNVSAEIIFPAMGEMKRLFVRGSTVHEIVKGHETEYLSPLSPERFCSLVEDAGKRVARKEVKKDKDTGVVSTIWRSTTFPVSSAKILLETDASRKHLPPIRQIVNCPIMTAEGKVLTRGYHDHSGGTYIGAGRNPEDIPFGSAVRALLDILGDFEFAAKSDLSRAFANLISPALKMGGWINDDFPMDLAEATESQSGKTFRHKLACRIYNEVPSAITLARGGVGSIDESISAALVKGRPFVTLANMRGKTDSTILEEILRGADLVTCRTIGKSTEVSTQPFLLQYSTNGSELTRDLANRSIVTRIRKKPAGYEWKKYSEGGLEQHIIANQSFYLGCVFSVLSKWKSKGCLLTTESRHDFRGWCRALDGIVQLCGLEPLLDGHREQQLRTSNPQLQWLRKVILAARPEQHGVQLFTHDLTEIAEECDIDFPGNPNSRDEPYIKAGRILGRIFREANGDSVEVDGFIFTRTEEPDYSPEGKGYVTKKYTIEKQ